MCRYFIYAASGLCIILVRSQVVGFIFHLTRNILPDLNVFLKLVILENWQHTRPGIKNNKSPKMPQFQLYSFHVAVRQRLE